MKCQLAEMCKIGIYVHAKCTKEAVVFRLTQFNTSVHGPTCIAYFFQLVLQIRKIEAALEYAIVEFDTRPIILIMVFSVKQII